MKTQLLVLFTFGLAALTLHTSYGQTIDPTFQPTSLYTPANTTAAVSQPDGKRLVLGPFARTDAGGRALLVRYNADNTVDQAFASATATLSGSVSNVRVLPSGKLLLVGDGPVQLGSVTRQDLLLLNADGTPDASFDAGTASGSGRGRISAVQADGKILIGGTFTTYNGVAARRIVRLLPTGAIDASFSAGTQLNDMVEEITLQADGKILVGGAFDSPAAVARLLPNGALDPTFSSPFSTSGRVSLIGVQADGGIVLASSGFGMSLNTGGYVAVARLLTNGALDPAFVGNTASYNDDAATTNQNDTNEFVPLADGSIICPLRGNYKGVSLKWLVRLTASGTYDPGFVTPFMQSGYTPVVYSLRSQPDGKLLVAGSGFWQAGRRNNVAVLDNNGNLDAAFNPVLLAAGSVLSVAQQNDGKVLAGGGFDEINGVSRTGLARFNTDGSLDASFALPASLRVSVNQVKIQPDGKILVSCNEPVTGTSGTPKIIRLLSSGALDNTFQPPATVSAVMFVLQPDGGIVVSDNINLKRLLPNGQLDNAFTAGQTDGVIYGLGVQPDGKILVGGAWDNYNNTPLKTIVRLEANGTIDQGFRSPIQSVQDADADEFLVQPDGKIVVGGFFDGTNPATIPYGLFRMLPNGATDNTFSATLPTFNGAGFVRGLALQPNGRILVAAYGNGLIRVLANGQPDTSFGNLSLNNDVEDLLVQPDGKIVAGGYFSSVGNQSIIGLTRLTAPNVLHVANAQLEARTQAWPVPAHETLNLSLEAAAQPQSVQLLDNLGRTVLTQSVSQATLSLPLQQMRAGVYLLRVNYAAGPVTRRIVVE